MKLFIVIPVLAVSLSLYATIINIPADFSTIQEGINSSIDSDTVLVQPGIYNENIDFNGHRITLGSLFLTTADSSYIPLTVIDGGSSGTAVSFLSGEDSTAAITGFTIQNGLNLEGGGGILCDSSDPVITNNIIKDNTADSGAGIKCISSNTKILYNIIHSNSYVSVLGNPGGGICCINGSDCIIMFNVIHHNQNQDGAGIASYGSDPIISNNVIYENEAVDLGGGMRCQNSNAVITNNTFFGNTSLEAGGIYVDAGCNLTVVNNIFWNNLPNEIAGDPVITYSVVDGGYSGIGNIDEDPLFVDPENGDFHLQENSPCIDAGDPEFPYDPDGTIADMGALYFDQGIGISSDQHSVFYIQLSNYPNPFNQSTEIRFHISDFRNNSVELDIFNLKGQRVITLVNERLPAGRYSVVWNGTDDNNQLVSSGIYFYQLKAGNDFSDTRRMLLLK